MKYHCYLPSEFGINELPFNPCEVLGFRTLRLARGESHSGASGDRSWPLSSAASPG